MSQPVLVITTCDRREVLEEIAFSLVQKKFAACCQIAGPVTSVYRWQDKIENTEEWVCQIKSVSDQLTNLVLEIKRIHSFEEPEIVSVEITGGSEGYLRWIETQCDGRSGLQ